MTKIETGSFYRFENGNIVRVIAQGFDSRSGRWVRYETMEGREGDTQLNDAMNYWKRA